jgi:hypothetical protein
LILSSQGHSYQDIILNSPSAWNWKLTLLAHCARLHFFGSI